MAFVHHAGIPSLNLSFGRAGNFGTYHSIYDSYAWFTTNYKVTAFFFFEKRIQRIKDELPADEILGSLSNQSVEVDETSINTRISISTPTRR